MRLSPRAWFASPFFPWVTGGVLTVLAVPEIRRMDAMSPVILAATFAATVPLIWRRSHPAVAYVSVAGSFASWLTWGQLWVTACVAGSLGFFTLARHRVTAPFVLAACGAAGAFLVNWLRILRGYYGQYGPEALTATHFVDGFMIAVAIVATVSLGDALRSREETRKVRDTAQARLIAEERRRAVAEERAVIARELHDVVAHSVSVIALQAESATYTTPDLSPQARDGFQQIAASARSSLTELRQLLGVLRSGTAVYGAAQPQLPGGADLASGTALASGAQVPGGAKLGGAAELPGGVGLSGGVEPAGGASLAGGARLGGGAELAGGVERGGGVEPAGGASLAGGAELAPQPSLADLEHLMAQHRAAGGSVTLRTAGARGDLPGTLELTAYRIVQEALTNVRRHAPGAHAMVDVEYRPGRLDLSVADDGSAPAPAPRPEAVPGHGLAGMRERAALLGGRLTVGQEPGGGFRVAAELPVRRPAGAASGGAS
ncbi:sensor histidine kinase [Streptomyces sclerotialus]|uniref:sensor histidine kinase n=1 Tax=Streptomyces sclerotialus TaxID=1957 RepID=UPI00068A4742